jgi:hypothetical protein
MIRGHDAQCPKDLTSGCIGIENPSVGSPDYTRKGAFERLAVTVWPNVAIEGSLGSLA